MPRVRITCGLCATLGRCWICRLGLGQKGRKVELAKRMVNPRGFSMAKGMNKQGKNVKKPKKEVAKTAVVLTPSTKNTVVISGGKARD